MSHPHELTTADDIPLRFLSAAKESNQIVFSRVLLISGCGAIMKSP